MSPANGSGPTLRARVRQQEVVADLGQQALETDELDALMHDAAAAVAETLECAYATVLELRPSEELLLREGVGYPEEFIGSDQNTGLDSQASYTLRSEEPIVVEDYRSDDRFVTPTAVEEFGITSGISVTIGSVDEPFGVLGVHSTEHREFARHDAAFVQSVANVLASAVENERATTELEDIYGRISDAFFGLDDEWRFTYLNEQAHELINPEGRQLEGTEVWDEFPAATERKFKPKYERAVHEQETVAFEEYYPEPLDTWFEVRAYPSETGLSVYFKDITERKAREQALTETKRRFEAIFEDPNILVGLLDTDGVVLDINETAMEYIHADLEAVQGEPFWETPWWGDGEGISGKVKEWTNRAANGEYVDFEADLTRPDGERYTLDGTFRPVTDENGEVISVIVSDRDITERREYERQLEQSEQRYRTLAESFPNGIVTLYDDDLRYTVAEGQALRFLSVSKEDLEGQTVREVWDEESASVLEPLLASALRGEEGSIELSHAGREWLVHTAPITDSDGEVFAGMTMAQDITEQVEREQELERSNRRLEESNERLEQFAYAASHDLQEPLRMVSSYLRLIDDRYADRLDEDGQEFLAFAVDGADRMREMIDALLDYSRVETRGDPLEPVSLDTVVEDVLADLSLQIDEANADVRVESLPRVAGDPNQLRQLFQNLLDNALTYAGAAPPTVRVSAERTGDDWEIAVRDEGIGMEPTATDGVFEVFQRLHSREEYEGTGIGLALCERIVERHGGEIWAESEPGEGSTFTFTLPAEDDEA